MFRDLIEITQEFFKKILSSRLFALGVIFLCMFAALVGKLFDLQIIHGEETLNKYIQMTLRTVYTPGTRGNILDRNGKVLAYNELAYSVTIQDVGAYKNNAQRNAMLLRLVNILDKHGETVEGKFEVGIDQNGDMMFTSSSEAAKKRFLRDFYGLTSTNKLDDAQGKYPSNITAREVFEEKVSGKTGYDLDKMKDEKGNPIVLDNETLLKLINIRYTMSFTEYQKYETTTVASNISDETMADISEHMADLQGVNIEESTIRIYNDSVYFAPIIGYTGKVQEDQLDELQKHDENYRLTDVVGRIGIESSMEYELQGKKGVKNMYVDNKGRILKVEDDATEPVAGNDISLTIDWELQVGIYNIIEQQLAGILTNKLVNREVTEAENKDSSKKLIPVKDAYFQLVNNNVLSLKDMADEDASEIEKSIHSKFLSARGQILSDIRNQLQSENPTPMNELPEDMKAYMQYIYTYLSNPNVAVILVDEIDSTNPAAQAFKNGTSSLREFLYAGIANSWIDTTKLNISSKYSNADDSFQAVVDYVMERLLDNTEFSKKIYRYLVNQEVVTGRELCLALYAQGVLPYDEQQVRMLTENGNNYAFSFLIDRISNLDITPAQLALDPCTAGATVVDVKTGEVLALVTYPSYDNNLLSGTVDAAYYNRLNEDLSLPLYNNATQVLKAPGSTFKPIMAVAALEEGAISTTDTINCTGEYDEIFPPIKCWIHPGRHGELNLMGAIQNSCNFFFADVAHQLSTDENGVYSTERGVNIIRKYATMFGLDHTSGIEISENAPSLTTEAPERSAMGQGNNSYTNVQLARYVTAIANRGNVFELSLINKINGSDGTLIKGYTPNISNHIDVADTTWDVVQDGMRAVVKDGSAKAIFKDLEVDIAGKTGTAQENTRANHGFFISYGPYTDPEISVTVNIPYGYTASNAATIAKNIYRLYYKYTDLDYILNTGALDASDVVIRD